jgi:methionyl-tRNA formyltransferase
MIRIIIIGNQPWAVKVAEPISRHIKVSKYSFCKNEDELNLLELSDYDILITIGLSNRLNNSIYEKIFTIGLHCAELDRYSAGTPLQNQIIDGLVRTKHRIFPLKPFRYEDTKKSQTRQVVSTEYSHQVDLCLHGNINDIFNQLTFTSIALINLFLDDYPDKIEWKFWDEEATFLKRRVKEDSKILIGEIGNYNTLELYNLIRCLEDPYPNFAIEDEMGVLYIKSAIYKSKK